jgi:hypothetical protein
MVRGQDCRADAATLPPKMCDSPSGAHTCMQPSLATAEQVFRCIPSGTKSTKVNVLTSSCFNAWTGSLSYTPRQDVRKNNAFLQAKERPSQILYEQHRRIQPTARHYNIRLSLPWLFEEEKACDAVQKAARQWLLRRKNKFYRMIKTCSC